MPAGNQMKSGLLEFCRILNSWSIAGEDAATDLNVKRGFSLYPYSHSPVLFALNSREKRMGLLFFSL